MDKATNTTWTIECWNCAVIASTIFTRESYVRPTVRAAASVINKTTLLLSVKEPRPRASQAQSTSSTGRGWGLPNTWSTTTLDDSICDTEAGVWEPPAFPSGYWTTMQSGAIRNLQESHQGLYASTCDTYKDTNHHIRRSHASRGRYNASSSMAWGFQVPFQFGLQTSQ